jgi:hypothetical protein
MPRLLLHTFAALLALTTGCSPKGDEVEGRSSVYQRIADETEWTMRDSGPLPDCINWHSPVYHFERVDPGDGKGSTVSVRMGGKELFAYTPSSGDPSYFEVGGVFYYADYHFGTYGCTLVAFDLLAGKELWRTNLKGIGPVRHSKYRNQVWIEPLYEGAVIVFGNEAAGKYIEIVDRKTGQTLGHRLVKEKK